jgi:hypothetical protein
MNPILFMGWFFTALIIIGCMLIWWASLRLQAEEQILHEVQLRHKIKDSQQLQKEIDDVILALKEYKASLQKKEESNPSKEDSNPSKD